MIFREGKKIFMFLARRCKQPGLSGCYCSTCSRKYSRLHECCPLIKRRRRRRRSRRIGAIIYFHFYLEKSSSSLKKAANKFHSIPFQVPVFSLLLLILLLLLCVLQNSVVDHIITTFLFNYKKFGLPIRLGAKPCN